MQKVNKEKLFHLCDGIETQCKQNEKNEGCKREKCCRSLGLDHTQNKRCTGSCLNQCVQKNEGNEHV